MIELGTITLHPPRIHVSGGLHTCLPNLLLPFHPPSLLSCTDEVVCTPAAHIFFAPLTPPRDIFRSLALMEKSSLSGQSPPTNSAPAQVVTDAGPGESVAAGCTRHVSEGGGETFSSGTESLINSKSSSTCYCPFVHIRLVKLCQATMHASARRHKSRGVSKRLQVASISSHQVTANARVRRLRVFEKPIDKAQVTRIITKAVTLIDTTNTIRQHNTDRSADYVEDKVNERVAAQRRSWRMDFADASQSLDPVIVTQPLVGGVQRVFPPFGGYLPDHGPESTPGNGAERGSEGTAESGRGGGGAGGDEREEGGLGEGACRDTVYATGLADGPLEEEEAD